MSNTDDSIIKLKKIQDLEVFSGELPAIETAGDVQEAKSYADQAREAAEQAQDIVDKLSNDIAYESEENTFTQVNTFDNDVVVNGDITMSGKSLQERLDGIEISVEEGFESLPTLYAPLSHAYNNDIHFVADQKQTVLDAVQNSVEHIDNQSIHVTESQKTTWDETSTQSASHIGNSNIHVTEDQKQNWDSSYSQITEHVQDNVIHVTQSDRNRWDQAQTGLQNHVDNTEIHITQEERTKWNALVPTQNTAYLDQDNVFTGINTFDNSTTFNGDVSFSPSYSVIVPKATSDGEAVNLGQVNELIASSGGGSGDVTAAGDNTFTGQNTFVYSVACLQDIKTDQLHPYSSLNKITISAKDSSSVAEIAIDGNTKFTGSVDFTHATVTGLPGGGDVTSSGNNTFTGENTFENDATVFQRGVYIRIPENPYANIRMHVTQEPDTAGYTFISQFIDTRQDNPNVPQFRMYWSSGTSSGGFKWRLAGKEVILVECGAGVRQPVIILDAEHTIINGYTAIRGKVDFSNATVTGLSSGGGSGDVTAAGDNTFTGVNYFNNTVYANKDLIFLYDGQYTNNGCFKLTTGLYTQVGNRPGEVCYSFLLRSYWQQGSSAAQFPRFSMETFYQANYTNLEIDEGKGFYLLKGYTQGWFTQSTLNTEYIIIGNTLREDSDINIVGQISIKGSINFSNATVTGLPSGGGSINIVDTPMEDSSDAISSRGVYSALYGDRAKAVAIGIEAISSNHGVTIGYEAGIQQNPSDPTQSWGSVAIGTNTEVDLASYSVVIGCSSKAYGIPGSVILGQSSCAPSTMLPESADQLGSILIGTVRDKSEKPNIIIGSTVRSSGNENVIGIGKGLQLENATNSITIGAGSGTIGSYSTAIGFEAWAYSNMATSIGSFSKALVQESVAIGPAVASDKGVTVIGSFHGPYNARYTLVYIISNGSELAEQYTDGYSAIGFVVYNTETSAIIESGIIPLKSLCTQHWLNFSPAGLDKLKRNFDY